MVRQNDPDMVPLVLTAWAYDYTVQRAHAIGEKSLKSLQDLRDLFPAALPADLIEALRQFHAEPPEQGATWERRGSPRCAVAGSKLIIADAHASGPDREVLEVDRSWRGFAFLTDRPLDTGTIIRVREADGDRREPPGRAEVKYCRRQGTCWVVGCEMLLAERGCPA
jgi:hypothetical protein